MGLESPDFKSGEDVNLWLPFSSNPGHSARCERGQDVYQQSPFDDLDPLVQGGFVVAVEHRDGLLGPESARCRLPHRPGAHGAAGDLDAVVQCRRYGMHTWKRRQQRRMGIDDTAQKP